MDTPPHPPLPQRQRALYTVDVSAKLGGEYIGLFNDVARFVMIQVAIQLMLVTMDPAKYSLFSADFLILLLFVVVGVLAYWLVFRELVAFV